MLALHRTASPSCHVLLTHTSVLEKSAFFCAERLLKSPVSRRNKSGPSKRKRTTWSFQRGSVGPASAIFLEFAEVWQVGGVGTAIAQGSAIRRTQIALDGCRGGWMPG